MSFDIRFAIGHVVFNVLGNNLPMPMNVQFPEDLGKFAQRIWPIQQRVTWPPKEMVGTQTPLHDLSGVPLEEKPPSRS